MRLQPRVYQRGERGTWWVDYGQVGGIRKTISLRTLNESEARTRAATIGRHLSAHAESERLKKLTLPDATLEWSAVLSTSAAQAVFDRLWKNAKSRALRNDMLWTLSRPDFDLLVSSSNGLCAVTGLPLSISEAPRDPFKPSLDRIDNALGYGIGNCRLVLMAVNYAMNVWGEDVFRAIALGYSAEELRFAMRQRRGAQFSHSDNRA